MLADLEADLAGVGAHRVARLVHAGADRDDAAERALLARDGRHALVVDAVLEIDHHAVGLQIGQGHRGRPLGVIRLHRDEDGVERLAYRLELVDVERLHGHHEITDGAGAPEALRFHGLDVLWPLVDERDLASCLGETAADHRSDRARAQDADALDHVDLLPLDLDGHDP